MIVNIKADPQWKLQVFMNSVHHYHWKNNQNTTEYLTPKVSFRINPGDMHNNSTSKRLITPDNIFDINRIGATDAMNSIFNTRD